MNLRKEMWLVYAISPGGGVWCWRARSEEEAWELLEEKRMYKHEMKVVKA